MKTKTANLTICKKFDEWLETITDETVKKKVNEGSILTGGAIASMLLREPINDFDFYFKDLDTAKTVAEYYVGVFNQNPPQRTKVAGGQNATYEYFEGRPPEASEEYAQKVIEAKEQQEGKPDYRPVFLSDNAITLSGGVQLVIRFFGSPDEVHANYDFVHATNYWTSWERKITLRTEALECLLTKELRYAGSKYPICSLIRARKFIQREWTINAGQYLKIAFQINELELSNFDVLREQLIGMDVAYFVQVLALLKEKDPAKVNTAYLVEIIDRIFG